MTGTPRDISSERHPVDVNTLANTGPLCGLAGVWQGTRGLDIQPNAAGQAAAGAPHFEVVATQGLDTWGNCTAPLLRKAFRTTDFRIQGTFNVDGSWRCEEDTVLQIAGQAEPFHHVDRNTLFLVAESTPNPLARCPRQALAPVQS